MISCAIEKIGKIFDIAIKKWVHYNFTLETKFAKPYNE